MIARDRIARIIDPEAFANWRRYRAVRVREDKLAPADANMAADYQYGEDIRMAYRKADKIIARRHLEQI